MAMLYQVVLLYLALKSLCITSRTLKNGRKIVLCFSWVRITDDNKKQEQQTGAMGKLLTSSWGGEDRDLLHYYYNKGEKANRCVFIGSFI